MKKCFNCHQRAEMLDKNNLCEDCFDAMHSDDDFVAVYDHKLGKTNKERRVK